MENEHVKEDEDSTSFSLAHMLCMLRNPPMALVRFHIGHNSKAFQVRCTYDDDEDYDEGCPIQYGMFPLHLAAKYSESVELLQALLQLDVSMTKRKTSKYSNTTTSTYGNTPLEILSGRKYFPTLLNLIRCLIQVDNSVQGMESAIMICLEA